MTSECQTAFEKLKAALVSPTLLVFPDYSDEAPPLELHVDASDIGAGAMLAQGKEGNIRPIAFISMTFQVRNKGIQPLKENLLRYDGQSNP